MLTINAASAGIIFSDDFSGYTIGNNPTATAQINATVVDGSGSIGSGNALSILDPGTSGSLEEKVSFYEMNLSSSTATEYQALSIQFDLYNNQIGGSTSGAFIFGTGRYDASDSYTMNSNATRHFNLEFNPTTTDVKIRTGGTSPGTDAYIIDAPNAIAVFINDHDTNTVSYTRPDNAATQTLSANSFALFINNEFFAENTILTAFSVGEDSGLGRIGFYSGTSNINQFTIDNILINDLTAAVPEPSTYAIFVGLGIMGFLVQRRNKQSKKGSC